MDWLPILFPAALIGVAVLVPGYLVASFLPISRGYRVGFTPTIGLAVLAVWMLLWNVVGLPWGWAGLAVLVGALLIARLVIWRSAAGRDSVKDSEKASWSRYVLGVGGVVTFVVIQFWSLSQAMGSARGLPHLGDADFHLQGAKLVFESGNVLPLTALAELYDPVSASSTYYPTLWHALVALALPVSDLVVATNAAVLVVSLLFWPLSLVVLGVSLYPKNPYIAFVAPVMAAPIAVFPGTVGIGFSIFPFALALTTIPVGVAALLVWQRSGQRSFGIVYLLAVVAGILAQPTSAVLTIAAGGVVFGVQLVTWAAGEIRAGRWKMPVVALSAVGVLGVFLLVRFRHDSYLQALASYPRPQMAQRPVLAFFDGTVAAVSQPWVLWWLVVALAVVGSYIVLKRREGWSYTIFTVILIVAFIAAAGPDSTLRALTGPWYKDHLRLAALASSFTAVLAAVPLAWLVQRFVPNTPKLPVLAATSGVAALVLSGIWILTDPSIARIGREHVANGYTIDDQEFTPVTTNTVPVLERLDEHFESGEYILAAHGNGGGFIPVYSETKPFVPTRTLLTKEQRYLAENLDSIFEDPEVCELLNENSISGFMADVGREGHEIWGPLGGPPILDVSEGFELVDREGTIKVWRITACE